MFQEKIKKALEDRNLTQVAKRSGVPYMTVYKLAKGDHPTCKLNEAVVLGKYLGIKDANKF